MQRAHDNRKQCIRSAATLLVLLCAVALAFLAALLSASCGLKNGSPSDGRASGAERGLSLRIATSDVATSDVATSDVATASGTGPGVLLYNASPSRMSSKAVTVSASLSAESETGIVTVSLDIANKSRSSVFLDPALCELLASGTFSGLPYEVFRDGKKFTWIDTSIEIKKREQTRIELFYKPVSDPALFERYRLSGDLSRTYAFSVSCVSLPGGKPLFAEQFEFSIPEHGYESWKVAHGLERRLSTFGYAFDRDAFVREQTRYLRDADVALFHDAHGDTFEAEHARGGAEAGAGDGTGAAESGGETEEAFVRIAGDEIYLDQLLIAFAPYRIGDTVFVSVKIVNRMQEELKIDASGITLVAGGATYNTVHDFSGLKSSLTLLNDRFPSGILIAGRNDRARFTLSFPGVPSAARFSLDLSGITTYRNTAVFCRSLDFEINP